MFYSHPRHVSYQGEGNPDYIDMKSMWKNKFSNVKIYRYEMDIIINIFCVPSSAPYAPQRVK